MLRPGRARVFKGIAFLVLWLLLGAVPVVAAGEDPGLHPNFYRSSADLALDESSAGNHGAPPVLAFEDHEYVNPFTGGVAWETSLNAEVLAMEWAFIGVSEVLPLCAGGFDWSSVDGFLSRVASRGHQAILRPVFFGPGYGSGASRRRTLRLRTSTTTARPTTIPNGASRRPRIVS